MITPDECRQRLARDGLVVERDAFLDDEELLAFSRELGEVVIPRMGGLPDHPGVDVISLDPAESELAAYRRGTFFWHLDGATDPFPQKATFLTALHVADEGGDTEFANTYAAYEALPDDERAELEDLRVVHSFTAAQLLITPDPSAKERAAWDRVGSREHPLVWRRRDGRRSLLIGATADRVVGLAGAESRRLLDRLLAWVTQPRFVHRHQWRFGDLVAWDNTGMLHRALPYEAASRRLLHRTTLVGDEEVTASA